jgi:hypothetical protein
MKQANRASFPLRCLVIAWLTVVSSGISYAATTVPPIYIGALLSLTGNWSSLGTMSKTLLLMAKHDVNNYLFSPTFKWNGLIEKIFGFLSYH